MKAPAEPRGSDRYRTGLEVFKAGDVDGAAAIWEAQLSERRGGFTLQLMTACSDDTIRKAQRAIAPQPLFLVAKKLNGRNCFRVCAGTFDSREAAVRALAALPPAYRSAGAAVRPVAEVVGKER